MKRLGFYFIYIMIIIMSFTSCTDKNAKLDETNKFLDEDYAQYILPVDEVNDLMLDKYENKVEFTEAEQASINKHKGQVIKVAIPTEDGFYDNIDGVDLGINYFAGLQLEKDLGLTFEYEFMEYDQILEKLQNNEVDIIVGKNSSAFYSLYNEEKPNLITYISDDYYSTEYAAYSKKFVSDNISITAMMANKCGVLLPQRESQTLEEKNAYIEELPNVQQASTTDELLNMDLEYLILPESSKALQHGYKKLDFSTYTYEISSKYAMRFGMFDEDFVSAVNKTINSTKELSLNEYKQSVELIKCSKGYFFTPEEQAYIDSNPVIKTKYLPSVYPASFYDEDTMTYNGKLVAILNRIGVVTGLEFENVSEGMDLTTSELLANLYNEDIDLGVGVENAFNRSMYVKFSDSIIEDDNVIIGYKDLIKESSDIYKYNIGFVSNSSVDDFLNNKYPTKEFTEFDTIDDAYTALSNHKIDYLATSKNTYYYLVNSNNDYSLKNIFSLALPADARYAAPRTEEGMVLIDIINKVTDYVEADQIVNANYPLSEIDTVGSYRTIMFIRIFIVIIFSLIVIGVYLYKQKLLTDEKAKSIRILNNRLDAAFEAASFAIFTNKIGNSSFIVNETGKKLLGILDEDLFEDEEEECILFDTIIEKYLLDDKSRNTFDTLIQLIYSVKDAYFKEHTIQLAIKYHTDKEHVRYFDIVVNADEFKHDHIVLLFKDTTKDTLYERYENVVNDTDILTKARNREAAYKLDLSNYYGKTFGYIDIDNFNLVNTTFGHRKGDGVLSDLVAQLSKSIGVNNVFRMNGDEFLVILDNFDEEIADSIQSIFTTNISFGGHEVSISASIGYYTVGDKTNNSIEEVINIADYAKTQSKENGKNMYTVTDIQILDDFKQTNMIDVSLKRAISNGDIIPFYQPYIDIETNKVVGYETLMRWKTEEGILSPYSFLSIAIKSGDIYDLDLLMFRHSASFLKKLQDEGLAGEGFVASSNFTPLTLVKVNPFDLAKIAAEIGVAPRNMTIEVTEQLFASDKAFDHIKLLKQYGFNIALDDFSVGHSSMAYLKRLSVDVLKIDKSLLDDTNNRTNLEIFKTVVSLGKSLNAKIISEGVETKEEVEVLFDSKVKIGQGYYFARPADIEIMHKFVSERNRN